ncbi:Hth-type transcriptional regulator [Thalictrum thalictroides]|uniref:Hth-type transcriptional regulator n=1 Tax=Thalictrum thalictroides TaxID=46969 RepID=A0A7J6UQV2_THATH|nr:Hth-type transcriptional regulator [Thalictrum thalictroides]
MGSCFSSFSEPSSALLTAKVITLNGTLQEYLVTITASQVLESESSKGCFVCNSDKLYYDEFIQALDPSEELQVGQIYFILPYNRLQYRLSAQDMAALAVKASSAIAKSSKKGSRRSKDIRISPVSDVNQRYKNDQRFDGEKRFDKKPLNGNGGGITRSGSVRKLQRNASRRAKLAIRSFRIRLNTIYEGSALE